MSGPAPARPARLAIVGAGTLKGKELKEVLEQGPLAAADIRLLDDDEALGQLDAVGEEITFIQPVHPDQLEGVDVAFFASSEDFTRKTWKLAAESGAALVDLSGGMESIPESGAVVRAPWLEREWSVAPAEARSVCVAHPAAVVLALLLSRAARAAAVRRAVVTMFEPASEHGRRGMDELHQQTVNLLSFQKLPQEVFDSQVAFNLVARYGEAALPTLESVERRILAHFAAITGGRAPVPSLMLLQPPVFHGHTFSIYLELEEPVAVGDVAQVLAGGHVTVARLAEDSPSNVSAAGQEHILVSLRRDANHQRGLWMWAAADNLRLAALLAAECGQSILQAAVDALPQSRRRAQ